MEQAGKSRESAEKERRLQAGQEEAKFSHVFFVSVRNKKERLVLTPDNMVSSLDCPCPQSFRGRAGCSRAAYLMAAKKTTDEVAGDMDLHRHILPVLLPSISVRLLVSTIWLSIQESMKGYPLIKPSPSWPVTSKSLPLNTAPET